MKMNFFCLTLVAVLSLDAWSQDIHFSQLEFSPLTLNPALAGANSPMQGIINYRNQWNSVAVPFKTVAASFDMRFNERKRDKKGIIAGGINFFNDQAGDLKVNTNNVNLNLAYHLILNRQSTLGIGLYSGYGQRFIDPANGRWGIQFDGFNYDAALPSQETINNSTFSFMDVGTGLLYAYRKNQGYSTQNNHLNINIGFSAFHLNRPNYSYLGNNMERLMTRYAAFVNADIGIPRTKNSILPGIYFQRQGNSSEMLFGGYYKYTISEGSRATGFTRPLSLSLGLFSRFRDALVGKILFDYDQYSIGFAYDINVSSLTTVSKARGGFELFLRFNMNDGDGFRTRI